MAEIKEFKEFVQIGKNAYIALGDAITKLQTLPDKCVDLIITDPPYNLGLFMKKTRHKYEQVTQRAFRCIWLG